MTTTRVILTAEEIKRQTIRSMVRGVYDLQTLRIQTGNRIVANFKDKLGQDPSMSEKELEKKEKSLLNNLRLDYARITDGVVEEFQEGSKLITEKKFKPGKLIDSYTELCLFHQYVVILKDEEAMFARLKYALADFPIYNEFLKEISGLGPALSAVIVSEIDIKNSEYVSSLWKYTGLDVVHLVRWEDPKNSKANPKTGNVIMTQEEFIIKYNDAEPFQPYMVDGKFPVTYFSEGRSKKSYCLVKKPYTDREGFEKHRDSITFNPFLKTKLVGVLGGNFLKAGSTFVDGVKLGEAKRLEFAIEKGFDKKQSSAETMKADVISYLESLGCEISFVPTKYGKLYYDYRARLNNDKRHDGKTDFHKHNMANRYMIKMFLADLYAKWRELAGLPVVPPYAEAKLGLTHGVATFDKQRYYQQAA